MLETQLGLATDFQVFLHIKPEVVHHYVMLCFLVYYWAVLSKICVGLKNVN